MSEVNAEPNLEVPFIRTSLVSFYLKFIYTITETESPMKVIKGREKTCKIFFVFF